MDNKPVKIWKRAIAVFALLFGVITLFKSGGVLFGPQSARDAVGDYIPFVVTFNFVAGFFYILAAIGIWAGRSWGNTVAVLIAVGTLLVTIAFAIHVLMGGSYEMQTVGALGIRAGFWVIIALVLRRGSGPS